MSARILVVEDDPCLLEAVTDFLGEQGHLVETACDGSEALARLEQGCSPDVIIMDLMMPRMNGYEFRARQLDDPKFAAILTLVMTAGSIDARVHEMKLEGWLRKPLNTDA